jgi:ADP-ribosylglycohydrolase/sugar/nucleoside kinase (ribokinase family)
MTGSRSRAAGALYGLALGDALGMPTQSLSRAEIVARYGRLLDGFQPGPPDHPLAAGLAAGTVTDDTEQAVLLATLIVDSGGAVDPAELARRLLAWEESARARGSLDLLGPSTKRALAELLAGADVDEAGRFGVTNGAAMRITPVGVATPCSEPGLLLDRVAEASRLTHNTGVALAGAAAVAAAVSAGVQGAPVPEAIGVAVDAAARAAGRGRWVAAADVAARITWATSLVAGPGLDSGAGRDTGAGLDSGAGRDSGPDLDSVVAAVDSLVGTSLATQESVPAAFAVLAAVPDDPWLACRIAASLGGDCDTIAAMTGAIGGACHGVGAFPGNARATVARVNHLRLDEIAGELLAVRRRGPRRPAAGDARAGSDGVRVAGAGGPVAGSAGAGVGPAGAVTGPFDRLLHLGNVVIDVVLDVPALPGRGDDVLAASGETSPGGGFNVMAAAARQGLRVGYAGAHGSGPFGALARAGLASEGIDVLQRPKAGLDTGFVVVVVDSGGERTFLTSRGAEAALTAGDLAGLAARPRDAVYVSGYGLVHPGSREALLGWLGRLGDDRAVFFDPGPLAAAIPADATGTVLARSDWVTCNAREAALLTCEADPPGAARALARQAGRRGVLVRTGAAGCLIARRGRGSVTVPGFRVEMVDTNGAGDAHAGTFIAALASGADEVTAARAANAAAALAVTRRGPATAPTAAELARFLAACQDRGPGSP